MTNPALSDLAVLRWCELPARDRLVADVERVFFAAARRQDFADPDARAAFRWRWLGRYLEHYPEHVWLAIGPNGTPAGYLVGCLDDPAQTPLFSDIAYFATFAAMTRRYPAHLHINLDEGFRGAGIGTRLVCAFVDSAAAIGAPGVHVVTGAGMRNVGFYARNRFAEVARTAWNGGEVVMLARPLP